MSELGLQGRLADFNLEEILQLVALQQKTGLLRVDLDGGPCRRGAKNIFEIDFESGYAATGFAFYLRTDVVEESAYAHIERRQLPFIVVEGGRIEDISVVSKPDIAEPDLVPAHNRAIRDLGTQPFDTDRCRQQPLRCYGITDTNVGDRVPGRPG